MPAATRWAFSDPAEFQDAIPSSDVRIIVTKPGPFRADLTAIQLHRLSLLEGSTSLPLVARASEIAGRSTIMFLTNARQNPLHAGGKGLLPGSIGQPSLGAENYLRTSGECRFGVMHLPTEALSAASLTLCGRDLSAPAMTRLVTPCAEAMKRLMRLRSAISRFAFAAPDTDARPEVAKAIEHALIETMVACLDASDAEPVNDNPRHDAVMRRFERALDAHEGEPLYLLDLCSEIGISDRALRRYCEERIGMGPRRYLWLRRMHLARRALALADPDKASVTEVATANGFGELGRFSVQYRTLFGESPSQTLRRPPDVALVTARAASLWGSDGRK